MLNVIYTQKKSINSTSFIIIEKKAPGPTGRTPNPETLALGQDPRQLTLRQNSGIQLWAEPKTSNRIVGPTNNICLVLIIETVFESFHWKLFMQYFVESLKPSRMWHSKHLRWFFGVSYFLKQLQQGVFYLRIKQLGRILAYLKQLGCILDVGMVTRKEKK